MAQEHKTTKRAWKNVNGLLLLDKPKGLSSNTALQAARRLFSAAKAGHTGTLDPLASGLLPVCFGEATKFSSNLFDADKAYEATLCFGVTTTTGDAEGDILEEYPVDFSKDDLEMALSRFHGKISQLPPMYSALKHDGQPLYKLARKGLEVERTPREVTIHKIELIAFSENTCSLSIQCSKGTYIRTLAEDLAKALGSGAHLTALKRTSTGGFLLKDAFTLEDIQSVAEEERLKLLQPVDVFLQNLIAINLDLSSTQSFMHGNPVRLTNTAASGKCRVYFESQFLGIGEISAANMLQPKRLLSNLSIGVTMD